MLLNLCELILIFYYLYVNSLAMIPLVRNDCYTISRRGGGGGVEWI